jgi:hypothetical protein
MTASRRSTAVALAATGLLIFAMTSECFAFGPPGGGHRPPMPCTGSCQTNKAGNPGTVFTNGPAGKSGVGNASGGKTLKQN